MTERHGQEVMMRGTNPITQARRGRYDPAQRVCASAGCAISLSIHDAHALCSLHDRSASAATRAPRRSMDRELLEGIFAVGSVRTYRHPENGT
jgi:hypothetical protein